MLLGPSVSHRWLGSDLWSVRLRVSNRQGTSSQVDSVGKMVSEAVVRLRVLVCDGPGVRLDEVTLTVAALGHEVIARESSLPDVAQITAIERPDVALVIVREGTAKALELIDRIVHEAACPVIAVLDVQDRGFIQEAAKRGIFAYIAGGEDPEEMQSAIDIVLQRFAEYHDLDEQAAFAMLRDEARRSNRKLVDIAESVVSVRSLLPGAPSDPADPTAPHG